jgi:hypothetical protein
MQWESISRLKVLSPVNNNCAQKSFFYDVLEMKPHFLQLNLGWNADPNAPNPNVEVLGNDVLLSFYVNPFQFKEFEKDEIGFLRFVNCVRFRLGGTNDEGWYRGQCRFSTIAPEWGQFYEIFQRRSATTGAHQQTRQRTASPSVSRSGAGHGAQSTAMGLIHARSTTQINRSCLRPQSDSHATQDHDRYILRNGRRGGGSCQCDFGGRVRDEVLIQ